MKRRPASSSKRNPGSGKGNTTDTQVNRRGQGVPEIIGNQATLERVREQRLETQALKAEQAVSQGRSPANLPLSTSAGAGPVLQRKCSECEENEEMLQRFPAFPEAAPVSAPADPAASSAPEEPLMQDEGSSDVQTSPAGLIIDDRAAAPRADQMRKSDFLEQLRHQVCTTTDQGLSSTDLNSDGCPWIAYWFDFYGGKPAAHVEKALRRYAPEAGAAISAQDYLRIVSARVRRGVDRWVRTGDVSLPEGVPTSLPGAAPVLRKSQSGGPASGAGDAATVRSQLGRGAPLEGGVRSRMESAFGANFGSVRLHTDAHSGRLAGDLKARAFTVGKHVAFAPGEYRPNTVIGDALLAHELAHVVQQAQAPAGPHRKGEGEPSKLEDEADLSAVGAVARLWGQSGQFLRLTGSNALPRLRSGLRLQRCSCQSSSKKDVEEAAKKAPPGAKAAIEKAAEKDKCPTGDDKTKAESLKQDLIKNFALAGVTAESGSCWTPAELEKMKKAFGKVPKGQQGALAGVTLTRVVAANCAGHSADGCFESRVNATTGEREDVLKMGDGAFSKDKDYDAGDAKLLDSSGQPLDLVPSHLTAFHEVGHAVEDVEQRTAEAAAFQASLAANKEHEKAKQAFKAFDQAMPAGGTTPGWNNSKEKAYSRALGRMHSGVNAVYAATKPVQGGTPGHQDFKTAAASLKKTLSTADTRKQALDQAAAGLPSGSAVRDTLWEGQLETALEKAKALLKTLEDARDAFGKSESAKAAEARVTASIKIAGAAKPTEMSRRLAEFVGLIHVRKIDVSKKAGPSYGIKNWPARPAELFADLYEWSITDPNALQKFDPDVAKFFTPPIGVKGKRLKKKVDQWITANS